MVDGCFFKRKNTKLMSKDYTDLEVWQEVRKLVNKTYTITKSFPNVEQFGLTNQMRRSAVSILSNIAEGCGRQNAKGTLIQGVF